MTVIDPHVDPARRAPDDGGEALIKEARRLRRRRWCFGSIIAVLAAGAVALGLTVDGSGPYPASAGPSGSHGHALRSATSVSPVLPMAVAVVGDDVFLADPVRQEILERSPNGVFTVVAGTGVAGLSGDGGPATQARIDDPADLVALGDRSLAFEQTRPGHGQVVREITPGGVIDTVAGLDPRCAGVPPDARSIAANAALVSGNLSVGLDGSALLFPEQPCGHAPRLGPILELTPRGELTDTGLDASQLTDSTLLVSCGTTASSAALTAFLCDSGAGRPKRLLVLRANGTTEAYPAYEGGGLAAAGGEVVAERDYAVVRVRSHRLQTLASVHALNRLFEATGVSGFGGLAIDRVGDVFVVVSYLRRHHCGVGLVELTPAGHRKVLWQSVNAPYCY